MLKKFWHNCTVYYIFGDIYWSSWTHKDLETEGLVHVKQMYVFSLGLDRPTNFLGSHTSLELHPLYQALQG